MLHRLYRTIALLCFTFILNSAAVAATELQPLAKGQEIPQPEWFKDSFLDLGDDLEETADSQKRLILYFHQAGCPYCYNLITQVLPQPEINQLMQEHFDLVAFDLWGDRIVTLPDGSEITEKELAVKLRVQYTPTLIFLAADGTPQLRLDGYRPATVFRTSLNKLLEPEVATQTESSIDRIIELSGSQSYAIHFQTPGCIACQRFDKEIISRTDSRELLRKYRYIRIDLTENPTIKFPDQRLVSARQLFKEKGLSYQPSWLLLDNKGIEQLRIDAYVRAFHFDAALEFVTDRVYLRMPEFQRYINERGDRFRSEGKEVDILR